MIDVSICACVFVYSLNTIQRFVWLIHCCCWNCFFLSLDRKISILCVFCRVRSGSDFHVCYVMLFSCVRSFSLPLSLYPLCPWISRLSECQCVRRRATDSQSHMLNIVLHMLCLVHDCICYRCCFGSGAFSYDLNRFCFKFSIPPQTVCDSRMLEIYWRPPITAMYLVSLLVNTHSIGHIHSIPFDVAQKKVISTNNMYLCSLTFLT